MNSRRGDRIPGVHPQRERCGSDCTRTCSAKPIDDDAGFGELLVNTEMRQSPGSATGHHQAERSAGDSASKGTEAVGVGRMMRNRRQPIPPTWIRFCQTCDQVHWPLGSKRIDRIRRIPLIHQDHESVALRANVVPPQVAGASVGDHQDPIVASLRAIEGFAERLDELVVLLNGGGGFDGRRNHGSSTVRVQ